MTLQELNEHYRKVQMLSEDRELLSSVRASIAPKGQVLTGMPHAPGISDKTGDLAVELAEIEEHIEQTEREILAEEPRIAAFIETITDARTRLVFRLRFLRGFTWKEVAGVLGRYSTEDTARATCYRYFDTARRREEEARTQVRLEGFE